MAVKIYELEEALYFTSTKDAGDCNGAYLCKETGKIIYESD